MGGLRALLLSVTVMAAAIGAGGSCQRTLRGAPCPCVEDGWICCEAQHLCYPVGTGCLGTAGTAGGGGGGGNGGGGGGGGEPAVGGGGGALDASSLDAAAPDGEAADWLTRPEVASPPAIACGAATCPAESGLVCCYNPDDQSAYCLGPAVDCLPYGSSGIKTALACDGDDDCQPGLICCYTTVYIQSFTSCMAPADCVDEATVRYATYRRQACDPSRDPGECLQGTCQAATTTAALPPNLYLCK
jgi:hypothetical protein